MIAAIDRQTFTIGLFPKAQSLGSIARRETLIHECGHLATEGIHSRSWKAAMKRSASAAEKSGERRLLQAILRDVALYNRRPVTDREVRKQLEFILAYGERTDFPWVLTVLADWAGWPKWEFLKRYPWVRS
ncbi:MAG: hypothetical protein KIT79_00925 [Deltaproteobacteria bacterium]|nr:hypothetical protein [Deltaproteobacteria bacterium]